MIPSHLADAVTPITDAEANILGPIVGAYTYLQFRVIAKRGVICHWPSGEGVQFLTRRDPVHVRRLAEGWNLHFSRLLEKAAEKW